MELRRLQADLPGRVWRITRGAAATVRRPERSARVVHALPILQVQRRKSASFA
jgi:hypothetical protein